MSNPKADLALALLIEREGYVRYGRTDRVKAVDDELARLGVKVPPKPKSTK